MSRDLLQVQSHFPNLCTLVSAHQVFMHVRVGPGPRMCFSPLSNAFQTLSKRRFGPQANMFHTPSEDVFQSSYERISHAEQTRFTPCSNVFAREMCYTLRLTGTVYHKV